MSSGRVSVSCRCGTFLTLPIRRLGLAPIFFIDDTRRTSVRTIEILDTWFFGKNAGIHFGENGSSSRRIGTSGRGVASASWTASDR